MMFQHWEFPLTMATRGVGGRPSLFRVLSAMARADSSRNPEHLVLTVWVCVPGPGVMSLILVYRGTFG
eukprot:2973030-Rhodomonas_salina.5